MPWGTRHAHQNSTREPRAPERLLDQIQVANRIVEGFRARTPPTAEVYRERAGQIAEHGYSDGRVAAVPGGRS